MIDYDLDRAKQAVQFLASSPYFAKHVMKIRTAIARPRSLPFKHETEFLNELVIIGRQSEQAFENLVHVAQSKRNDRNDYQREFMANKRRRDRKVIELEELMTGAPVMLEERIRVLQRQHKVWDAEKQKLLAINAMADWKVRNELLREFWAKKEKELDELIVEARKSGPVRRAPAKHTVVVKRHPPTALAQAFERVMDPMRYFPKIERCRPVMRQTELVDKPR